MDISSRTERSLKPRPAIPGWAWRWSPARKVIASLLVIPDKMSQEKISHVRALGAEVRMTRSDVTRGHPEYYQDVAARLAEEIPGGILCESVR